MRRIAATVLLLALGCCATASADTVTPRDRFELWTLCKPVPLFVSIWDAAEGKFVDRKDGLAREAVEIAIRSRLRAANIYEQDISRHNHTLEVLLSLGNSIFDIDFRFEKWLMDPIAAPRLFAATTWSTGFFGTYGKGDTNHILGGIERQADRFIDEYLRVNDRGQCDQEQAGAPKKEMGHSGLPKSR